MLRRKKQYQNETWCIIHWCKNMAAPLQFCHPSHTICTHAHTQHLWVDMPSQKYVKMNSTTVCFGCLKGKSCNGVKLHLPAQWDECILSCSSPRLSSGLRHSHFLLWVVSPSPTFLSLLFPNSALVYDLSSKSARQEADVSHVWPLELVLQPSCRPLF